MIFGECPYEDCDEPFTTFMAECTPVFEKIKCEKCGRFFMELHSRIQPEGFTMDDFNKKYEVNEETKEIKERAAKTVEAGEQQATAQG